MRLWSLHCKYREPLSGKVWNEWKFFQKNLWLSCSSHPKTKKQRDCLCFGLDSREYGYTCLKRPRLFLKIHRLNWILCFAPKVVSLIILYYTGWEGVISILTIYFRKRGILAASSFLHRNIVEIRSCIKKRNILFVNLKEKPFWHKIILLACELWPMPPCLYI